MRKNRNASVLCVNNLPPTMKEATHQADSVKWLTATTTTKKTYSNWTHSRNVGARYLHIKDDVIRRHLEVSRARMTRLSLSETGTLPKWRRTASREPCLKGKKSRSGQTSSLWLSGHQRGRGHGKETALHFSQVMRKVGQHLDSSALWG